MLGRMVNGIAVYKTSDKWKFFDFEIKSIYKK